MGEYDFSSYALTVNLLIMLLENHKSPEPKVTIHVVRPTDKQFTIYLCKTEKKQNILTLEAGQGRPVEN